MNQPADHAKAAGDPGANSPVQGYAAHYCDVSTPKDPTVVACSFIASGLRVFDISDVTKPKEIAYYVPPSRNQTENQFDGSTFAMSKPAVVPSRREVWFTDGVSGFYNLRVSDRAWPAAGRPGCLSRRSPIGPNHIGRVRIGMTRKALLRRVPAPRRRTARSWRWCVNKSKGTVSAAFDKRGRVALRDHHGEEPRQPPRAPRQQDVQVASRLSPQPLARPWAGAARTPRARASSASAAGGCASSRSPSAARWPGRRRCAGLPPPRGA